jgi:hypothetical protein
LLHQLDLSESKRDIIWRETAGRSDSARDLYTHEARALIARMEAMMGQDRTDPLDRMRKKLLYYGYMLGFDQPLTDEQRRMSVSRINLINTDAWCRSDKCAVQKSMKEMDAAELTQTVSQMAQMYKKTMTKLGQ